MLGPEPEWVKEKRAQDIRNFGKLATRPWSPEDDAKLRGMISAYRFTYPEIAKALRRTEGAVKRRLHDLGIKGRPVRLNNHIKWTAEETKQLLEMYKLGYGYNTMAEKLGKSALGIRGKLERMGYGFHGGQLVRRNAQ